MGQIPALEPRRRPLPLSEYISCSARSRRAWETLGRGRSSVLVVDSTAVAGFACRESLVVFATATELTRDGAALYLRVVRRNKTRRVRLRRAADVVPRNESGAWVLSRSVATLAADFKTGWWL